MRIIDDGERVRLRVAELFHTAGDTYGFDGVQCVGVIERYASRMGDGDGRRRIEVVEVAIDGQMVVAKGLISVGDVEGGVRRVGGPGDDVRTGAGIIRVMQGEGGHADAGCLRVLPQQIGVQTVRAEYQRLRVDDDLALAIQVILERGVFDRADVVGGDVQERGHIESQSVDAVHLVRLGRDLHHQILHAVIGRLAHHAEGVHRFGRGQIGLDVGVAVKAIIDRGEQCGLAAGDGVDKRLREVRGGRLALGAGDADDRELVLRISVERGGQQAHRLTCVVDDQAGGGGCG